MKFTTKYTPIAVALATLIAGPAAATENTPEDPNAMIDTKSNSRVDTAMSDSKYKNDTKVKVDKSSTTHRNVDIDGEIEIDGDIEVESGSSAMTNQNQNNYKNTNIVAPESDNGNGGETFTSSNESEASEGDSLVDNNALAVENGLQGASGNIGLNISAGTNNAQDNSAALSKVDAEFVFAAADAVSNQNAERNTYAYEGNRFNAHMSGNALRSASGNIAVNIAAGNSNLQANSLAASVNTSGTLAEATVTSHQTLDHNVTTQQGTFEKVYDTVNVTMVGGMFGGYQGTSDQYGDVYLDSWDGPLPHTSGENTGHVDVDTEVQVQLPDGTPIPVADFDPNEDGGSFFFNEEGTILLGGVFTGQVMTANWIVRPHENNASLSGDALRNASGNIGVNITSGTNNLQGNHLSIAAATGGVTTGGGE